jgi:hypothetical protein
MEQSMDIVKILPVKLTKDELREKGEKLAELIGQAEALKTEAKDRAKDYRDQLEILSEETGHLASIVRAKAEDRDVECRVEKNFDRGVVETFRNDTGETVSTETLTEEERQEAIAFPTAVEG